MQKPIETPDADLESDGEGPFSKLTPPPDVPPIIPELLNHPLLCASFRQIAQEETRHIHALKMVKSLIKAAEVARSYSFQIDCEEANDGLKNALFYFVEAV